MTSKTISIVKGVPINDATQALAERIYEMTRSYVVVGIPAEEAEREDKEEKKQPASDDDKKRRQPNNAELAYIHENGSPARRIPPRPFMKPGINEIKGLIPVVLSNGLRRELDGYKGAAQAALDGVGQEAVTSIRNYIDDSSHFEPLADSTIMNRARDRKKSEFHTNKPLYRKLRKDGASPAQAQSTAGYKPLIDTRALIGSITYGVRTDGND